MYLSISLENFITVGVMFLVFMVAFHLAGQAGIMLPSWLGSGS